jgi:hypothetical protein
MSMDAHAACCSTSPSINISVAVRSISPTPSGANIKACGSSAPTKERATGPPFFPSSSICWQPAERPAMNRTSAAVASGSGCHVPPSQVCPFPAAFTEHTDALPAKLHSIASAPAKPCVAPVPSSIFLWENAGAAVAIVSASRTVNGPHFVRILNGIPITRRNWRPLVQSKALYSFFRLALLFDLMLCRFVEQLYLNASYSRMVVSIAHYSINASSDVFITNIANNHRAIITLEVRRPVAKSIVILDIAMSSKNSLALPK